MITTMEQINALELRLQALLNDKDSDLATFHNERRLALIADMRMDKDRLWIIERQERAARRAMNQSTQARR